MGRGTGCARVLGYKGRVVDAAPSEFLVGLSGYMATETKISPALLAIAGSLVSFVLLFAICPGSSAPPAPVSKAEAPEPEPEPDSAPAREAASVALKTEPKIKDLVWRSSTNLAVGVIDDGTRRDGYALYVCQILHDNGVPKGATVDIFDIVGIAQDRWDKLGHASCNW